MSGKTKFYMRWAAQDLSEPHNIISIGEDGDDCKLNDCHTNVLRLLFSDITEFIDEPKYILFSDQQADLIIDWLLKIEPNSMVIVHCEGGISRSAAVVKFMIDFLDYDLEIDRFCKGNMSLYNTYVYDMLVTRYTIYQNH